MKLDSILSKPAWAHFLAMPELQQVSLPALVAADEFFDWIKVTGIAAPSSQDYAFWARSKAETNAEMRLTLLLNAFKLLIPSEESSVADALSLLTTAKPQKESDAVEDQAYWDPCAEREQRRKRSVSINPLELPDHWIEALRRSAKGLPCNGYPAPSPSIIERAVQKLCQFAWSVGQEGLDVELNSQGLQVYLTSLEGRLVKREHGIRWATIRATVEELHRFARYLGTVSAEDIQYFRKRLSRYELLERGQDALKFLKLFETGHTTLSILDQADALFIKAAKAQDEALRHRLRNAGVILGLYSIVPLRNADAELIFGETLLWQAHTWIIDTKVSKTSKWNQDHLVVPLEPEFARYIDKVVLGDHPRQLLPELRKDVLSRRRPLIVHSDGSKPEKHHIPRVFKEQTDLSFTTTRTMLHTDQAVCRGEVGTLDAMAMAHQTSPKTPIKYQEKRVRQAAVVRIQDSAADRREELISGSVLDDLKAFTILKEVLK